jgi:phosphate:Na+ symporter
MLAGLAVFMFGLKTMSERLEKQAGNNLRKMFGKATNNKYMGLAVGAGVTAIIQSSSATTVMVVGFVNAGVLTLLQATAVIMGANIGTTITAVLISLPVTEIMAASGVIGVFMVKFSKKSHIRNIGYLFSA